MNDYIDTFVFLYLLQNQVVRLVSNYLTVRGLMSKNWHRIPENRYFTYTMIRALLRHGLRAYAHTREKERAVHDEDTLRRR